MYNANTFKTPPFYLKFRFSTPEDSTAYTGFSTYTEQTCGSPCGFCVLDKGVWFSLGSAALLWIKQVTQLKLPLQRKSWYCCCLLSQSPLSLSLTIAHCRFVELVDPLKKRRARDFMLVTCLKMMGIWDSWDWVRTCLWTDQHCVSVTNTSTDKAPTCFFCPRS